MKIHGLIYICPECRKVTLYSPAADGVFNLSPQLCAGDGYVMKMVKLDSLMVDQMLKGEDVNATPGTTGA